MDSITTAIVTALSVGALSGLTETSTMAITNAYQTLKALIINKYGVKSKIVHIVQSLETKPDSMDLQEALCNEVAIVRAMQDKKISAAADDLLAHTHIQQTDTGKFSIQNIASVQGQIIGDHNTIIQPFGDLPKI